MVRTRHSGGADGVDYKNVERASLHRTRQHRSQADLDNGYDSDDFQSIPAPYQPSPRRSRSKRRQVIAYEAEVPPRQSSRSRYTRDSPEYDGEVTVSIRRSARQRCLSEDELEDDSDELEEQNEEPTTAACSTSRRSCNRNSNNSRRSSPAAGDFGVVRRSGRQRKALYSSYNQNVIDNHISFLTNEALDPEEDDVSPRQSASKRRKLSRENAEDNVDKESLDMYTRVKRDRKQVKRDMYGMAITEGEETKSEDSEADTTEGEDDGEETEEETEGEEDPTSRQYNLREHKPRTNLYEAPAIEPKVRRQRAAEMFGDTSPRRSQRKKKYHSPARRKGAGRKHKKRHSRLLSPQKIEAAARRNFVLSSLRNQKGKRAAFHGSDTTSSSDSSGDNTEDADERRFERRKAKSMAKSRSKCLPMNFEPSDVASGAIRDRQRMGASLADIDPMSIDRSITFDSVGGLGDHLLKLKEMIVFPLLYPELFERYKIQPPRGCLFYGPPGTGKTLVARALANECSQEDRKVAFFMRKGADCLSKWVGESERQLRLLFDQAYQSRPSIIFFDEIDGLAPVRSSRQDQIHSSIVSTLLALMDGLDSRGEVVVIGATNRIDSIDPALRRPGRFDREFFFSLPALKARKQILAIHMKEWVPPVSSSFLEELAEKTVGYCGADLKSLCTEATLHALRRRYPQIYQTNQKLQLDVSSINLIAKDFHRATQGIVPAAQRAVISPSRCLVPAIRPLLQSSLDTCVKVLATIFPSPNTTRNHSQKQSTSTVEDGRINLEMYSDSDDEEETIHELNNHSAKPRSFLNFTTHAYHRPATHRPRLLLAGDDGQAQTSHLAPAVLHHLEGIPVHTLDLPALHAVSAMAAEESCAQIFREAKRTSPSIIYMPHIHQWWMSLGDACRSTFLTLLDDIEPSAPILVVATAEVQYQRLSSQIANLFSVPSGEVVVMQNPNEDQRRAYFEDLLFNQATKPPSSRKRIAKRVLEVLPAAPPPQPRQLTDTEKARLRKQEEATLRELRLFLRDTLVKLGRDRKFNLFSKPVDEEEVPDYSEIISQPMDLSTMMSKIDLYQYQTVQEFLDDIDLICRNALEYNPDTDNQGRAIRHRACALKDTVQAIVTTELDMEFEKLCEEIKQSRAQRGDAAVKDVPDYYFTKPLTSRSQQALGGNIPGIVTPSAGQQPKEVKQTDRKDFVLIDGKSYYKYYKRVAVKRKGSTAQSKSPWCKPSKRSFRRVLYYVGGDGYEFPASEIQAASADEKEAVDEQETSQKQEENPTDMVEINGKRYKKMYKRVKMKRSGSKSPWCKSSKIRFRQVLFYVDEEGKEIEASKLMKENGDGEDKDSEADSVEHSQTPTNDAVVPASTPLTVQVTQSRRTRSNSPQGSRAASMSPANRSSRSRSAGCSPRCSVKDQPHKSSPSPKNKKSPKVNSRSKSRSRSRSRSRSQERESTPSRMVNGGSPGKSAKRKLNVEADTMDTITEVPSSSSLESADCSCQKVQKSAPSSPVKHRVTRSTDPNTQKAMEILSEKEPEFVINKDKLKKLLSRVVQASRGFNVEKLQRLYCVLSQTIYHHRRDYDKSRMLSELDHAIERFK